MDPKNLAGTANWHTADAKTSDISLIMRRTLAVNLADQRRGDILRMNGSDVDQGAVAVVQERPAAMAWYFAASENHRCVCCSKRDA
jgi:hypothetical protein